MVYDKSDFAMQHRTIFSINGTGSIGYKREKKNNSVVHFISKTNINSRRTEVLNVKGKTLTVFRVLKRYL